MHRRNAFNHHLNVLTVPLCYVKQKHHFHKAIVGLKMIITI